MSILGLTLLCYILWKCWTPQTNRNQKNKQVKNFRKISGLFWIDVHTQKQLILALVFPILKYRLWAKDNLVKKYWRQITGIPLAISFRLNANQSFWKVCMMFGLRKLLSYYLHAQNKFGSFIDIFLPRKLAGNLSILHSLSSVWLFMILSDICVNI